MPLAIAREISPSLARCELTHVSREPIDMDAAHSEHREYVAALEQLGCEVHVLPAEPDLPDSVFVEDAALVLDELAVIMRPGAPSRRPETVSIRAALEPHRHTEVIEAPGTLDGGDVLRIDKQIFVGLSSRSNEDAIEQLSRLLKPYGYSVTGVELSACLHLKSAVSVVAPETLLINPEWVNADIFARWRMIEIDPAEPFAANAVAVGGSLIHPTGFDGTQARLAEAGLQVVAVDTTELQKAEGGVTCCSLIFEK
jgi:dimethylargininase